EELNQREGGAASVHVTLRGRSTRDEHQCGQVVGGSGGLQSTLIAQFDHRRISRNPSREPGFKPTSSMLPAKFATIAFLPQRRSRKPKAFTGRDGSHPTASWSYAATWFRASRGAWTIGWPRSGGVSNAPVDPNGTSACGPRA